MLKKLVYSLVTKTGIAAINFAILIISSRYLGVSSRGEISIFVLNISLIQLVNEAYTGYSIIHFIPQFNFKKVVVVGLIFSLIFCSLSNCILVWLNKQLVNYEWIAYLISVLVIINTFNCVLILAKQNLPLYNILSFSQPLLLLVGIVFYIFVLKIFTVDAFVFPLLFSFAIAFVCSALIVSKYFYTTPFKSNYQLKPILMNGILYQSGSIMFVFCNRYSYYLLPEKSSVGLYASASSLMEAVLIIVNAISPVLLSRIAHRLGKQGNWETSLALAKASFVFSILTTVCVLFIPASFFTWVLGIGFEGIKIIMIWYAPAVLMAAFFMVISNYFVAMGNQKLPTLAYGLGCIVSLITAPYLVTHYGVKGATINAFLAFLVIGFCMTLFFLAQEKVSLKRLFSIKTDIQIFKNWNSLNS